MENKQKGFFENFYQLSKNNTNVKREIIAGITTFLAMSYILPLIPQVLAAPFSILGPEATGGITYDQAFHGIFIATCIIAFIGTMLHALYSKLPYAQAPGIGLNAFFAYTVVLSMGYTYQQGLAVVFISGVIFILLSIGGARTAIMKAIPDCIKGAITPGIGLFLTIVGLKNCFIVVNNSSTMVGLIDFSLLRSHGVNGIITAGGIDYETDEYHMMIKSALLALVVLVILIVLYAKNVKGAMLISIIIGTILAIPLGLSSVGNITGLGKQFVDFKEVSFLHMDFPGLLRTGDSTVGSVFNLIMLVIAFALVNMFDTMGTLLGAAKSANMLDENGNPIHMEKALLSDAISSAGSALVGSSTCTTVAESSLGVAAGGRTGLTSFVTGILLLLSIVFAPVISLVPAAATSPALILLGVMMMSHIKDVDFSDMTNALPAFLTVMMMPFTYSIANGIALGLISYIAVKLCARKWKEINWIIVIMAILFAVRFAFMVTG